MSLTDYKKDSFAQKIHKCLKLVMSAMGVTYTVGTYYGLQDARMVFLSKLDNIPIKIHIKIAIHYDED